LMLAMGKYLPQASRFGAMTGYCQSLRPTSSPIIVRPLAIFVYCFYPFVLTYVLVLTAFIYPILHA
jgi:hypothetical protein